MHERGAVITACFMVTMRIRWVLLRYLRLPTAITCTDKIQWAWEANHCSSPREGRFLKALTRSLAVSPHLLTTTLEYTVPSSCRHVVCQELAHEERRSRDCWRSPQLKTSTVQDKCSVTSSAKSLSLAWPIQVNETSLINIKNIIGPGTEPYLLTYLLVPRSIRSIDDALHVLNDLSHICNA